MNKILALLLLLLALPAPAQSLRIERISLTVGDLDRSEAFFRDGLGFETVRSTRFDDAPFAQLLGLRGASGRSRVMRLGDEEVEFLQFARPGRGYWPGSASPDRWFQHFAIIVADMDRAYAQLRRVKFEPISEGGPQTLPPQNGQVQAFKFRDPDGHPLELLHFPPGTGRPRWQDAGGRLFLGIDHTAIGVASTARSERFYRELLGMAPAYAVTNSGPTQENLDGTFNAVVRITGLRPESADGPGVEFLDYRAPAHGRPAPADTRANDRVHAHVTVAVAGLEATARRLFDAEVPFVSPGVVSLDPALHGHARGLMVRDPDGHALMLVE